MSVIGNTVEKFICVTLTQSLVTRYVIIPGSMVFLGLGVFEKLKKKGQKVQSFVPQVGGDLHLLRCVDFSIGL